MTTIHSSILLICCLGWFGWGNTGSEKSPVEIPTDDLQKITFKFSSASKVGPIKVSVYNGTDWTVSDVDITITLVKTKEVRRFRLVHSELEWDKDGKRQNWKQVPLKPYTTGDFEGDIGDFLSGVASPDDWSWGIDSARGYKNAQ